MAVHKANKVLSAIKRSVGIANLKGFFHAWNTRFQSGALILSRAPMLLSVNIEEHQDWLSINEKARCRTKIDVNHLIGLH